MIPGLVMEIVPLDKVLYTGVLFMQEYTWGLTAVRGVNLQQTGTLFRGVVILQVASGQSNWKHLPYGLLGLKNDFILFLLQHLPLVGVQPTQR